MRQKHFLKVIKYPMWLQGSNFRKSTNALIKVNYDKAINYCPCKTVLRFFNFYRLLLPIVVYATQILFKGQPSVQYIAASVWNEGLLCVPAFLSVYTTMAPVLGYWNVKGVCTIPFLRQNAYELLVSMLFLLYLVPHSFVFKTCIHLAWLKPFLLACK